MVVVVVVVVGCSTGIIGRGLVKNPGGGGGLSNGLRVDVC